MSEQHDSLDTTEVYPMLDKIRGCIDDQHRMYVYGYLRDILTVVYGRVMSDIIISRRYVCREIQELLGDVMGALESSE